MTDYATDSNTVAKTYTWGLDLSGQLQGAGGVGGLLCVTQHQESSTQNPYYPSYDANGNVSEYVDDSDSVVAHYEYSPFGKLTSSSGTKAGDFRHRFSTKYQDTETALYYYGYRYYSAELGRWISRDPIGERGGTNLYMFIFNDSTNRYDLLGVVDLSEFSNEQLKSTSERIQGGQDTVMEVAQDGDPSAYKDAKDAGAKVATPYTGSSNPVVDKFERNWIEKGMGVGAHFLGQISNLVDGLILDEPGNFYNYWGMIEVWRHQRFIDQIDKELESRKEEADCEARE